MDQLGGIYEHTHTHVHATTMNIEALNLKESVYGEKKDWSKERERIL